MNRAQSRVIVICSSHIAWWPNEHWLSSRVMNRIAWLCVFLASQCCATTVITIVTVHGIVICADSMNSDESSKELMPRKPSTAERQKTFIIQDRVALAHDGAMILEFVMFDGKKLVQVGTPYSVARIVRDLRRDTSLMDTIVGVATKLRQKLVSQFNGFDAILKEGYMKRKEGHPIEDDTLTHFTIAGYDGPTAHVYEVGVALSWRTFTHYVTPVRAMYPQPNRKNISLFVQGYSDAIQDLWKNPNSPRTRKFAAAFPSEYRTLPDDLDLSLSQMITLARGLLAIQIERTPSYVAYPLIVVTIPPGGHITTKSYNK